MNIFKNLALIFFITVAIYIIAFLILPKFPFLHSQSYIADLLSSFFTALAFMGLVLTILRQESELRKTQDDIEKQKIQHINEMIMISQIQAAGMRLISMSIQKDPQTDNARRELELLLQHIEEINLAKINDISTP